MIAAQTSRITKRLGKRLNFHLQSSISALSGFIPLICPTSPLGFLVDETRFPSQTRSLVRIVRRHETALSLSKASLALESLSSRSPVSLRAVFGQNGAGRATQLVSYIHLQQWRDSSRAHLRQTIFLLHQAAKLKSATRFLITMIKTSSHLISFFMPYASLIAISQLERKSYWLKIVSPLSSGQIRPKS